MQGTSKGFLEVQDFEETNKQRKAKMEDLRKKELDEEIHNQKSSEDQRRVHEPDEMGIIRRWEKIKKDGELEKMKLRKQRTATTGSEVTSQTESSRNALDQGQIQDSIHLADKEAVQGDRAGLDDLTKDVTDSSGSDMPDRKT